MAIEVDCRGKKCPEPVIMTKKALDSISQGRVVAIVDNEVARDNVMKLAKHQGYNCFSESRDGVQYIYIDKEPKTAECAEGLNTESSSFVILVTSDTLGKGSEELGKLLMRNYIYTLKELDRLPKCIMFINKGVYLAAQGSESLEVLKELESKGVEILSCGTCLDYYGLKEKLAVGSVTNMYTIAQKLSEFRSVVL
ncbi:MAG: sulfurtransferase-like selenium metabolism protein YedF [Thermosediminibacteraceae bacterium]|nr:sulfurtransferase-like selenium metabolism protein YedF [Thermosediminibacteraceae bacterium]